MICLQKKNQIWLSKADLLFKNKNSDSESEEEETVRTHEEPGPSKRFNNSSFRTKKRRVQNLVSSRLVANYEVLTFAAQVAISDSGRRDAANIIKQLSSASHQRVTYIKKLRTNNLNLANNICA